MNNLRMNNLRMNNLKSRFEKTIKDENNSLFLSFRWWLIQLSKIYEIILKTRSFLYQKDILKSKTVPCYVISIGNITTGGTGKTPMTIYMVKLIQKMGYKVAVVSRGYKGTFEKKGGVVSDGKKVLCKQIEAGDESFMLANCLDAPVVVGQNRYKACITAYKKFLIDVIVLDDAFQHLKLKRNFNIVLLDHTRPFGNGNILPAGTLREGIHALNRGDMFILTRSDRKQDLITIKQTKCLNDKIGNKPVLKSTHKICISNFIKKNTYLKLNTLQNKIKYDLQSFKNKRCFLFSGLADNKQFQKSVIALGINIVNHLEFPDHYTYTIKDFNHICKMVKESSSKVLLTTEKDFARISWEIILPVDLIIVDVKIAIENSNHIKKYLLKNI